MPPWGAALSVLLAVVAVAWMVLVAISVTVVVIVVAAAIVELTATRFACKAVSSTQYAHGRLILTEQRSQG